MKYLRISDCLHAGECGALAIRVDFKTDTLKLFAQQEIGCLAGIRKNLPLLFATLQVWKAGKCGDKPFCIISVDYQKFSINADMDKLLDDILRELALGNSSVAYLWIELRQMLALPIDDDYRLNRIERACLLLLR